MKECVFCSILEGAIPSERFYEDERFIVIKDIEPKANLHYLAIPKKHYKLLSEMTASERDDLGYIMSAISQIAKTRAWRRLPSCYKSRRRRRANRFPFAYPYSRRTKNGFSTSLNEKTFEND